MAPQSGLVQANDITKEEFDQLFEQYPNVIKAISDAKGAKDGQKTLQELDEYRYGEAVKMFSGDEPEQAMHLDHVKTLVEWKLQVQYTPHLLCVPSNSSTRKHGKFRPTLMKLVSGNDPKAAADILKTARDVYRQEHDAQAALDVLTKLKGIGPATASLLLTVQNPTRVIFFSDEAFYWLCCKGGHNPIKYNAKEYKLLCDEAQRLSKRLGVSATDVEKVAYVLLKQNQPEQTKSKGIAKKPVKQPAKGRAKAPVKKSAPLKDEKPSTAKPSTTKTSTSTSKRKQPLPEPEHTEPVADEPTLLRRSKRRRA